jgi:hypothetical protein
LLEERPQLLVQMGQFRQMMLDAGLMIELAEAKASDKQLEYQRLFFARAYRTFAALGGNRSGKSIVNGVMCFAKWIRDLAKDGDEFWCVAPTFEKSVGQQKLLWDNLPRWMFKNKSWDPKNGFDGQRPIISVKLPNARGEAVISFKTCEQEAATFEQSAICGAWCDERMPFEIYQRLIPRTIDRRGWILISDIPEQDWHYFELMHAKPEALVYCIILSMYDNEHNLPIGEIAIQSARMSDDEKSMRIFGEFRRLSGVVFQEFDRRMHVIRPFAIPSDGPYPSETNWPRWRSIDVGGSAPTACTWLTIAPNERIYCYRQYYQPFGNVGIHARAIKDLSLDADGRPEKYINTYIDPAAWQRTAANEINVAQQYIEADIKVEPWPNMAQFGERAAVERMKRKFEHKQLVVFDTCLDVIRELFAWKYVVDSEGRPKASDSYENRNNHAIDTIKGFIATNPVFAQRMIDVAR